MSFLTRTPPSLASYKFPLPPSHLPATPPCHTPSATTPPSLLFSTFDFETYGSSSSEYDSCEEEEATTPNSVARDLGRLAFDRRDNDDGLTAGSTPEGIYPSFGDFLPPFEEQKKGHGDRHEERRLSGLGLWLGGLAEESTAPASFSDTTSPPTVFSPFDSKSPNTDSFTFCPPPSFGSTNFDPAPTAVGSSSAALLSPTPSYSPPPPLPCSTPPPSPTYSTQPLQHHSLPSRPQFVPSPSHPRRLRTPPLGSHSLYPSTPPSTPYPLSVSSTQHIALLHHGRVPTLSQLAPLPTFSPVVSHHLSQLPIMNTGNVGPMVVQAGDWHCGACGFTNWRRRKICMRCFPHAGEIGQSLTINSQGSSSSSPSAMIAVAPKRSSSLPLLPSEAMYHQHNHHQQQQRKLSLASRRDRGMMWLEGFAF